MQQYIVRRIVSPKVLAKAAQELWYDRRLYGYKKVPRLYPTSVSGSTTGMYS